MGGGDGFYTQNDPTDWAIVYAESQDGNTNRLDLRTGKTVSIRPRGPQPPRKEPETEQQKAMAALAQQFGFGGQTNPNIVPLPPVNERPRFYWNTPVLLSPHDPNTRLHRRRPAVHLARPRQHLHADDRPDEEHRQKRPPDHGRRGRQADGVQARRRRLVQQHRHDRRVAGAAGRAVGRHQRRQPAGEPRRRRDLEERRRQPAGRAEGHARVARRGRPLRGGHVRTRRSTATAPTT